MNTTPDDPEQYIRNLDGGSGRAPGPSGPAPAEGTFRHLLRDAARRRGRVVLVCAVAAALALVFVVGHNAGGTTVHGNLIMLNSGATDRIDCNNGSLKLDGDNNTYTITGHCRRLEISGSANHVTADSVDTISILGDDNAVVYRSGSPTINRTGNNDIVDQRPGGH
ncbi:DUF3060 domain-containing protein [Mycobacterium sp. 050134]|uniref:DUF3060 domain-containing protein n=1 Tax=Mycobacterium sp. 050134 TaxID=3096111 RepID=UPI002EDAA91A